MTKKKVQVFRDLSKLSPGNERTMEVGTQLALKVNKISLIIPAFCSK